jgi:hypothetical protein
MVASQGIAATIPPRVIRKIQPWYDPLRYRTRHLVENYFADLKQFRGVGTRWCKLGDSSADFVHLASWVIETRTTRRTAKEPVYRPATGFPRTIPNCPWLWWPERLPAYRSAVGGGDHRIPARGQPAHDAGVAEPAAAV